MPRYVFQLDRMHVNNQRGKRPDKDVVTFGVQVGADKYALVRLIDRQFPDPPGDPFPGAAEGVSSGDTIEFGLAPPRNPRRRWEIGPIDIANDDAVLASFTAVNTSDAS